MEFWNYIFANAQEIMFLCFGISVFMVALPLRSALVNLNKVLKRANYLLGIFEKSILVPLKYLKQFGDFLNKFI